mmetsp:Transcript_13555/g.23228  ORF Transcript_13555/g.23228 Transcript_13555/m.23228 type:complete len:202 (-) Transcript_13555:419-1024(-)
MERGVDDEGVQEALPAHLHNERAPEVPDLLPEPRAELLCLGGEVFVTNHLQRRHRHCAGQGVPAVCAAVLPRADAKHDLFRGKDATDWIDAARKSLSENKNVGLHSLPIAGEQSPSAADAGLNLVRDEKHVVLLAQAVGGGKISIIRNNNPCLSLDWLHEETRNFGSVFFENISQRNRVIVRDPHDSWRVRSEPVTRRWII